MPVSWLPRNTSVAPHARIIATTQHKCSTTCPYHSYRLCRYSEEDNPSKNGLGKTTKPTKRVKPNATKCESEEGGEAEGEEEYLVADDSVQTYFTEGTPLNFSTATSLTDLREQAGGATQASREGRLGTQEEVHGEEEEVRSCCREELPRLVPAVQNRN